MNKAVKMFLLVLSILLCAVFTAHSQNVFNNTYSDFGSCAIRNVIAVDSGYIIAGGHSNPNVNVLIGYIDLQGNLVSYKSYGDSIYDWYHGLEGSLIKTSDDGFALAGSTGNTGLLFKFNSNLDTLWKHEYIFQTTTLLYGCAENESGFALVGYQLDNNGQFCQMLLLKTDINGNYLWYKHYGGQYVDEGYKIITTNDGGFLLGGHSNSFNPEVTPGDAGDWYLVKTDSLGNMQWQKHYGNPELDDGRVGCIIETHDSCYIVTGAYATIPINLYEHYRCGRMIKINKFGNIIWDKKYLEESLYPCVGEIKENEDHTFVSLGRDILNENIMIKYTSTGEVIWKRKFSMFGATTIDDFLEHIAKTDDGGFIMVGWGLGEEDDQDQQAWIIKTDSLGCDGYMSCQDTALAMHCTPDYVSVHIGNSVTINTFIDNGKAPVRVSYSTGDVHYPVYISLPNASDFLSFFPTHDTVVYVTASYGNNPGLTDSVTVYVYGIGIDEINSNDFEVTPNPAKDIISISNNQNIKGIFNINLYDIEGKLLISKAFQNSSLFKIDVSNLLPGIYFVKIQNNDEFIFKKLVIER